jgi:hypothetical protein
VVEAVVEKVGEEVVGLVENGGRGMETLDRNEDDQDLTMS